VENAIAPHPGLLLIIMEYLLCDTQHHGITDTLGASICLYFTFLYNNSAVPLFFPGYINYFPPPPLCGERVKQECQDFAGSLRPQHGDLNCDSV
jgi:hypothetical protein